MDWKRLLRAILFITLLKDITCKEIIAQVNPKRLVQYVPERFLSMTIDPGTILVAGNLGNEALTMARSLSPSFLRLGGKSTNYIQFGKELLMENTTITEEQWDSVYNFVSKAGFDLIASINPSNRINGVWDSRDALQLISYSDKQGYNLAWQLGYDTEGVSASGAEIGRDIVRLRKILDGFSKFAHAPLFGPDLQEIDTAKDSLFVHDLLYQAGPVLGAIFLQPNEGSNKNTRSPPQYLFNQRTNISRDSAPSSGPPNILMQGDDTPDTIWQSGVSSPCIRMFNGPDDGAESPKTKFKAEEDPGQSIMDAIVSLDSHVWGRALRLGRILPRKPIWIAEREVSQGTSENAIQLIKRLGAAARIGVQVVMRQVGPEALNQPTPEFWVALIYKNLVGRGVLDARISSGNRSEIPIFSHCSQALPSDRSVIDAGMAYDKGAVTVFGVNESPEDLKISLRVGMKEEKVHLYSLTFSDNPNGKMEETYMNGQPLTISPSGELPILSPRVVKKPSRSGIVVPGKSVFFIVLPDVKSRMCTTMPLVHAGDVKDLSKKLIQVATDVLEKPHSQRVIEDEDSDKNKIYVKFGKRSNPSITHQGDLTLGSVIDKTLVSDSVGSLSSSTMSDKVALPDDKIETTPGTIVDPTTISMDNCTSDLSGIESPPVNLGDKARRKRSLDDSPVVDMEFSSSHGQASQEELVKQFNSYARKVYESSRSPKSGGDIHISNIPEEIFNTLKKVKVTFKNLGTTSRPTKLLEEVTEKPFTSKTWDNQNKYESRINEPKVERVDGLDIAEPEQALDEIKQPDVYNEERQEDTQRVPKQADYTVERIVSNDSKDVPETGENTFRGSQSSNDAQESEREKTGEETEPRPEAELVAVSSRVDQNEDKQRLPRDDTLRQGESPSEPSTDEGSLADESARNSELGQENETINEPTKDDGDSQQSKPPVSTDSLPDAGTSDPSQSSTSDNKYATEEKENLDETNTENTTQIQSSSPEIKDKRDQKNILTTTEIPDLIAIEGVEPKKVDELLLKIAKSDVNGSEVLNKEDNNIKSSTAGKPTNKKQVNEDYEEEGSSVEPKVAESEPESSRSTSPTTLGKEQLTEEGEESEVEKSEAIKEEQEVLQNGPEIPTVNSPDTVKVVREIPSEDVRDTVEENGVTEKPLSLVLEPSMNLSDRPDDNENEQEETEYISKPVSEDNKEDIVDDSNANKEQESSFTENQVTNSQEDLDQGPIEKPVEKDDDDTEVKQFQVASFRSVPIDKSQDKSYTLKPSTSIEKTGGSEVEDLTKDDNKEVEEAEILEEESDNTRSSADLEQSSQLKSSKDTQAQSEESPEVRHPMVTIPFQPLIVPFPSPLVTEPSSLATRSNDKLEQEEMEKENEETEVESVQSEKKDNESTKLDPKATTEKEQRRLKLLAIRNQIMEARERFKAAAREEGWRAALQRREEGMRNLLQQEREKRKFIALPVGNSDRTLLSRPRRLTYDPVSGEASKEDIYDYGPERAYNTMLDMYGLPLLGDYNKPHIPEQTLPLAYNSPEQNHVIFPLDPKAPQAVVYNNRIIPAKLYGVISVNDEASKLAAGPHKQVLDLPNEPLYSKYAKPYDVPSLNEKYEPYISEAPSLKPTDNFKAIPRDTRIKRLDTQPNFIPVVVLSNTLRKKRALPDVPIKKVIAEELKNEVVKKNKTEENKEQIRKKRSLSPGSESYNYVNEIPKDGHLVPNEIKPEAFRATPGMVFFEYPQEIDNGEIWSPGKAGQARTIGGLPPLPALPPPLPLLPPLHPVFPEPLPLQEKHLPEPLQEKTRPDPPQTYIFTMLQDKFKSLLGMIEGLADWCGANK